MISVHGLADALLGIGANGYAYADAISAHGDAELHRLYAIEFGSHIDRHADGALDFNFDGTIGEEGVQDQVTYLQPYVEKAFETLVAWVEEGTEAPESKTVTSDPVADLLSPDDVEL